MNNEEVAWYVWVGEPMRAQVANLCRINDRNGISHDATERVEDIMPGDIVSVDSGRSFKQLSYYGGYEYVDEFSPPLVIRHSDGAQVDRTLLAGNPITRGLVKYTKGKKELYELAVATQKSKHVLAEEIKKQIQVEIDAHCKNMGWK